MGYVLYVASERGASYGPEAYFEAHRRRLINGSVGPEWLRDGCPKAGAANSDNDDRGESRVQGLRASRQRQA
jgi:hypothetical protein